MSTESEASAKDVAKIIRQVKAEHIAAVFMENITTIACSTRSHQRLVPRASSIPTRSPRLTGRRPTYLDMFRHNIGALTIALSS